MKQIKKLLLTVVLPFMGLCSVLSAAQIDEIKEQMIDEMKLAIKDIEDKYTEQYGKIPFGRIFTNDVKVAKIVAQNGKNIEAIIPLENLLDNRIDKIEALDQEVKDLEVQKTSAQVELTSLNSELGDANKELITLEAKIAPLQALLTKLDEVFAAYSSGDFTTFGYKPRVEKEEVVKDESVSEVKKSSSAVNETVVKLEDAEDVANSETTHKREPIVTQGSSKLIGQI